MPRSIMNKFLILFLLILFGSTTYAQIVYEQNYSAALKKSQTLKKPIFIFVAPKGSIDSVYRVGPNEKEASQFYNTTFINVRLTSGEPDALRLMSLYKITSSSCYIFISNSEQLIFKRNGAKVDDNFFIDLGKEALDRLESQTTLADLDQKYTNGEVNRNFLRDYISLRIKTGTTDNAALIEKYVTYLTIAEFDEPGELLFIFKAGPLLSGNAYKLLYNNRKLANEIYSTLPLSQRILVNERIGNNTLNDAIATRNLSKALQSADFGRSSHPNNYKAGDKLASWNMMQYYRAVKDTANFFSTAGRYYDTHYMTVSLDSVQKVNLKAKAAGNLNAVDRTADRLNEVALEFYVLGARNYIHLTKAMLWSKRAIEINPDPKYYDTLAHIFYRLGLYDEAVLNQQKALRLSKLQAESKAKLAGLTLELKKMKERKL